MSIKRNLLRDPARLRQVLINLLSNAVKFTSTGVIDFQMEVKKTTSDNVTIYFEVTDTGIGITAEQMEIIFDPFTQAESGNTRKYGGTGLGLTITKNIIELMGGYISVESTPGTGSKFSFELTFDMEKAQDEAAESSMLYYGSRRPIFTGDVLLCEDNIMNQQVACDFLAKAGLNTTVAENGKIGVENVKSRIENNEKMFDLILMDVHMPLMDGLEATEKIVEIAPTVPIVAMTANIMPDDVVHYIKSGMKECLGKPFVSGELWSCLMRYMEPVSWHEESSTAGQSEEAAADDLMDKLELLIKESNADCLSFIGELEAIPGSGELISQLKNFDYTQALASLAKLKETESK